MNPEYGLNQVGDDAQPGAFAIRDAIEIDAPAVARLLTELGYPSEEAFARRQLRLLAASPGDRVLVCVEDDTVVGVVALHLTLLLTEAAPVGRITAFCVSSVLRSRGVGARMLAAVEALARAAGCERMEVTSRATRTRAHIFYARHGYSEYTKFLRKPLVVTEAATFCSAGTVEAALRSP